MARNNVVYIAVAAVMLILFFNLRGGHPTPAQAPPIDAHHAPYAIDSPGSLNADKHVEYPDRPLYEEPSYTPKPASPDKPTPEPSSPSEPSGHRTAQGSSSSEEHPIDHLIARADQRFADLLSARSTTLEDAAAKYRARRGRHPPPGFDQWFEYAMRNDAIISEAMFDTIYHDLEPFWGLSPAEIRGKSRALGMHVQITKGVAQAKTDWFWHVIWGKMINEVAYMLPDMMIALNAMDEPRLIIPWEDTTEYVAQAQSSKHAVDISEVKESITGWDEKYEESFTGDIWGRFDAKAVPYSYARAACPPDSPMRAGSINPFSGKVMSGLVSSNRDNLGEQQVLSYVENTTTASDVCQDAQVAAYHGAIISPLSSEISRQLLPMFGGSKFAVNNEILLPAAMYWNGEERFEQADPTPWSQKSNIVIWRGTATGGRHNAMNWPQFHRIRFVAQANGTKYALADTEHDRIFTPAFRHEAVSTLPKPLQRNLATWLDHNNDCQFTDLFCDIPTDDARCWYLDNDFQLAYQLPLATQYTHKFLPDIDGNSFSGRYRSFLQSKSVPIKATLFREWHDSRLIAWKHFVPMNNKFTDYYSIMSYFSGCSQDVCGDDAYEGHDAQAEAIGEAGSHWAQKVLRKVDMQIYIARLLLEYGRLTDDQRDIVGFVQDLRPREDTKSTHSYNQTERVH